MTNTLRACHSNPFLSLSFQESGTSEFPVFGTLTAAEPRPQITADPDWTLPEQFQYSAPPHFQYPAPPLAGSHRVVYCSPHHTTMSPKLRRPVVASRGVIPRIGSSLYTAKHPGRCPIAAARTWHAKDRAERNSRPSSAGSAPPAAAASRPRRQSSEPRPIRSASFSTASPSITLATRWPRPRRN